MQAKWIGGMMIVASLLLPLGAQAANTSFNISLGQGGSTPGLQVAMNQPGDAKDLSSLIKILILFTVISIAPAILVMCTSFTRILVVLSFLRQAIGIHNVPPNQILIAIALFLTAFNMMPVWQQIQQQAIAPYQAGQISWEQVSKQGVEPIRLFMAKHTRTKDLTLFLKLAKQQPPKTPQEVSFLVLIPAFIVSELKIAFQIGFLLYLPFLVVDMVVASILLSMGMMMLPPIMISLPFKILLFVLVDGWNLLITSLLKSFY